MTKYLPIAVTLAATLGAAIFTPAWLSQHVAVAAVFAAAAQILHAVLPSVFGEAK